MLEAILQQIEMIAKYARFSMTSTERRAVIDALQSAVTALGGSAQKSA